MAASVTFNPVTPYRKNKIIKEVIEWDCGAGAHANFSEVFSSSVMDNINGLYCVQAISLPGDHAQCAGTQPTDLYDIEIHDEYDVDIFGGQLKNRSNTDSEQTTPLVDTGLMSRLIAGDLTFVLTGNSVNDANGKLILYFEV